MITEDQAVAEVFIKFFINFVSRLKISTDHDYDNDLQTLSISLGSIIMVKNRKKIIKVFLLVP